MTENLSGLKVEYALALIYSSEAGQARGDDRLRRRPGDAGPRLPRRGAGPLRREARPSRSSSASATTTASRPPAASRSATARAASIPPQAKRLAPDLFFQQQVYRPDGGVVLLPPGELTMTYGRGPEYRLIEPRDRRSPSRARPRIDVQLERWIDPAAFGFYSGDHHIHAAGCAHYTEPDRGRRARGHVPAGQGRGAERRLLPDLGAVLRLPAPVLRAARPQAERAAHRPQVRRRGQRLRLAGAGPRLPAEPPRPDLSRARTAPRRRAGRPGPRRVLRWAKAQGAVTGYAHSATGLEIDPKAAAGRLLADLDEDEDGVAHGRRGRRGAAARATSRRSTPTATGC